MKRLARILRHPVVVLLILLDVMVIGGILVSPHFGYRTAITYSSICTFVNYCQEDIVAAQMKALVDSPDRGIGSINMPLDCELTQRIDVNTDLPEDAWFRCAARCQGGCNKVEECVAACPVEGLMVGYMNNSGDEIPLEHNTAEHVIKNTSGSWKDDLRGCMKLYFYIKYLDEDRAMGIVERGLNHSDEGAQ